MNCNSKIAAIGTTYKKRGGANAIEGHWYEIKFILFLVTSAQIHNFKYRIVSNIDGAGAFDDIVCEFEFEDQHNYVTRKTIFFQTKHFLNPENSKITKEDLLKFVKNNQGKFLLKKYFQSYLGIKEESEYFSSIGFDVLNAGYVIYTNTAINEDFLHYFDNVDLALPIHTANGKAYKIKKEHFEEFCFSLEGEEEEKMNFLRSFTFLVSQENQQGLESLIKKSISQKFDEHNDEDIKDCYSKANQYVQDWWVQNGTVDILTQENDFYANSSSNLSVNKIRRHEENVRAKIKERKIVFTDSYIATYQRKLQLGQVTEIVTNPEESLISVAKVIQNNNPIVFVDQSLLHNYESEILCNFAESKVKNMLVLMIKDYSKEFSSCIKNILMHNKAKKLVYIREKSSNVSDFVDLSHVNIIDDSQSNSLYITDLEKKTVERIHDSTIFLNGREVKISNIFCDIKILNINLIIVAPLLLGKQIAINEYLTDIKDVWNYYISRTLSQSIDVNSRSIKECTQDFFLVIGSTFDFDDSIYFPNNQYYPEHTLDYKHIFLHTNELSADIIFSTLCAKYKNHNVHMLRLVRNNCSWIKTHGSISNIINMTKIKDQKNERYSEKELVLRCNTHKTAIISNIAGMGKSILIKKLVLEVEQCFPTFWVQVIELNQFKNNFCPPKISEDIPEYLLRLMHINDILQKELFTAIYKTGNIAIIFDGFDEIGHEYEHDFLAYLMKLKLSPVKQIYITCRTNKEAYLEKTLGTLSYHLNELSDIDQESFLSNHWLRTQKNTDEMKNETEIKKLSKKLIGKLNSVKLEKDGLMYGIPLQLRMLAEIYNLPNEEVENITKPEHIRKIPNNLSGLYKLFIDKKISLAFEEKIFMPKAEIIFNKDENIIHSHELLAINMLFTNEEQKSILTDAEYMKLQKLRENKLIHVFYYGLLAEINDTGTRFVHHTYAEYFAASYFFRKQNNKQYKEYNLFFVNYLLIDEKFKILRKFLDGMIANDEMLLSEIKYFPFKLITKEKDVKFNLGLTPIHISAAENNIHLLQLFVNSMSKNREVKWLLNRKDNANKNAIYHAAENGNLEVVQYLYHQKSNLNIEDSNGRSILESSAYSGNWQLFAWLIENGVCFEELRPKFSLFLSMARFTGSPNIVDWLIKNGADDTYVENSGDTPLHEVSRSESKELIDWYLARGADINAKNRRGNTVLMESVIAKRINIIKYLLEKNADVNICNKNGSSIIHILLENYCEQECLKLLEICLEKGADKNIKHQLNGNTALNIAIESGKSNITEFLIHSKCDLNVINNEGETPLLQSILCQDFNTARLLIDHGADVNLKDENSISVLQKVSENGKFTAAIWLIKHGADIHSTNMFGETILHVAAKFGDLKMLKWLKQKGANLDQRDKYGNTSILIAAQYGKIEVVKYLFENGSKINDKNKSKDTVLMIATKFGNINISYWLIEQNADIFCKNKNEETVSTIAALLGKKDLLKLLISKGSKCEQSIACESALHVVAITGGIDECKWFLNQGINKNLQNQDGNTALMIAAKKGNSEIVKTLATHGASILKRNNCGMSAIHMAAESNEYDIVMWLIERGADINARNNNGDTILLIAARNNHMRGISSLIKFRADLLIADNLGNSILHIAVQTRNILLLKYLIEKDLNIDIHIQNKNGNTILMITIELGELHIFEYLLPRFKNIEAKNLAGETCLSIAAKYGRYNEFEMLIKLGADINHKNNIGDSVLSVALRAEQTLMAYCLILKGASINVRNEIGITALTICIKLGNWKFVKVLVNYNADIKNVDQFGNTILHHAAKSQEVNKSCKDYPKENIITFLIEKGANISIKNKKNESVLDVANKNGNIDIILMLSKYFKHLENRYVSRLIDKYLHLHYPKVEEHNSVS